MDFHKIERTKNKESRLNTNSKIIQFSKAQAENGSQRATSRATSIPRTTAQGWLNRKNHNRLDINTQEFLETQSGMEFLHRILVALELVITQIAGSGLRVVQVFLELSMLDQVVASSRGSVEKRIKQLESNIAIFGTQQEEMLGKGMRKKTISVCLDETFPSGICLVAIEPVSNYILLEKMAEKRDCTTWKKAMDERLEPLAVEIHQVTSDEAKALKRYAKVELEAHHSPDLFHIQQGVSKATAASTNAKLKKAEGAFELSRKQLESWEQCFSNYQSLEIKPIGRPYDYQRHIGEAEIELESAKVNLEYMEDNKEQIRLSNKAISDHYHPIDISTGKTRSPEQLEQSLRGEFKIIEERADDFGLSENSMSKIAKAKRMIESMTSTLTFFWLSVKNIMFSQDWSDIQKQICQELLIPLHYISKHATKARNAEEKTEYKTLAHELRAQLESNEHWKSLSKGEQSNMEGISTECINIFQRSSSNVEGRNGYLSLHHHVFKQMNPRKMKASTVIHNFFIKRSDNTTAAQRFFEQEHENLFEWLLKNTDYAAMPRLKRMGITKSCLAG